MRLIAALTLAACVACSGPKTTEPPTPGPEPAPTEMTLEEALTVVDETQARWPLRADHPLGEPKTLEDVEKILKLDQVTLFARGIEVAQAQGDAVEALALHGQIELAWAEAYMIMVEIMAKLHGGFGGSIEKKVAVGQNEEAEDLREGRAQLERAGQAFTLLLVEHLKVGWEKASETIEKYPDSYLGYRVAADYHRLVNDWEAFDHAIAKIKERNPDSNGLRFLQGVGAALQGERDRGAADAFYRDALEHDPDFVRAQAHLLMVQSGPEETHRELLLLKEKNPDHQVVAWIGDRLETAYQAWKAEQQAAPDS